MKYLHGSGFGVWLHHRFMSSADLAIDIAKEKDTHSVTNDNTNLVAIMQSISDQFTHVIFSREFVLWMWLWFSEWELGGLSLYTVEMEEGEIKGWLELKKGEGDGVQLNAIVYKKVKNRESLDQAAV